MLIDAGAIIRDKNKVFVLMLPFNSSKIGWWLPSISNVVRALAGRSMAAVRLTHLYNQLYLLALEINKDIIKEGLNGK